MTDLASKKVLEGIQNLVKDDLTATNKLILEQLDSDIDIIQKIANHIIQSGGKRLRPLLVLLSANYFGATAVAKHELATIIEFVHTATLLHDDVVDNSLLRRGQETANQIWGNQISVLVGDFLYSRAFQLLTRHNNPAVLKVLAQTTNLIAEGEISQLVNRHDPDITESTYLEVIRRKTACLFGAAAETGALLGQCTPQQRQAMFNYGLNLGIAFQIIDDLLDYTALKTETGKNRGDDLSEGRATLPLIYTLQHCSAVAADKIRKAVSEGDSSQLELVLDLMQSTQAEKYTFKVACTYAEQARSALSYLPNSPYQEALNQLILFIIERNY
ncbi:MAG: polyprenyl synthetase family protein [Proteobacteria bacterium]|nr:polyprenyl synthetase family protein [Pseudomonadota bacterium]